MSSTQADDMARISPSGSASGPAEDTPGKKYQADQQAQKA